MHIFLSVKFPWFLLPNHLTTKDLSDYFFLMKKFLLSLVILLRTFFLFSVTSAQFTSTTYDGQSHCAAPTPGVNYRNTIVYIGEQGDEFDLWFQANFDKQRTLLQEIFVADSKSFPEEELLAKNLDYLIVLPWHFRKYFTDTISTLHHFRDGNLKMIGFCNWACCIEI